MTVDRDGDRRHLPPGPPGSVLSSPRPSRALAKLASLRDGASAPLDTHGSFQETGAYQGGRHHHGQRGNAHRTEGKGSHPIHPASLSTPSPQVTWIAGKRIVMSTAPENSRNKSEEHTSNSPADIPESTICTYNMDDSKTPGGLKVRWKVRVITGPAAAAYDARQNAAIRELLSWACQQQRRR